MANSTFPTPSPLNATSLHTPAPSIFNSRVPSTPPIAPQIPTNSAFGNVNSDKWQDVLFTAFTSLLTGAVLMTLFECMRGRRNRMSRSMYRQRHSLRYRKNNNRLKRIDVPAFPRGFLRWWTSLRKISDAELYDQVGMDGYVTIRFIKLCKRLCFFAAFFGGLILIPIYVKGAGAEVSGTTKLSLSNVDPDARTMWAPVVFAWFFTLYFLYTMRKEFLTFSDLRNDWLAGGDVARDAQTNYTMRVERIPRAFRSPAILNKFFSELFPEQVHSATVCIGLQDLRALTLQRYKVLQALERAIIRKEALQETTLVRETWCGPKVDAVEHFGTRLAELNQKLRPKQAHKLEAAKVGTHAR